MSQNKRVTNASDTRFVTSALVPGASVESLDDACVAEIAARSAAMRRDRSTLARAQQVSPSAFPRLDGS
jgi:hypothetical protein